MYQETGSAFGRHFVISIYLHVLAEIHFHVSVIAHHNQLFFLIGAILENSTIKYFFSEAKGKTNLGGFSKMSVK